MDVSVLLAILLQVFVHFGHATIFSESEETLSKEDSETFSEIIIPDISNKSIVQNWTHPCLQVSFRSDILVSIKISTVSGYSNDPKEIMDTFLPTQYQTPTNCEGGRDNIHFQQKASPNEVFVFNMAIPIPPTNTDAIRYGRSLRLSFFYNQTRNEYWLGNLYIQGAFNDLIYYKMRPTVPLSHALSNLTSICNTTSWTVEKPPSEWDRKHEPTVVLSNVQFRVFVQPDTTPGNVTKNETLTNIDVCTVPFDIAIQEEVESFKMVKILQIPSSKEAQGFPAVPFVILVGIGSLVLITVVAFGGMYYLLRNRGRGLFNGQGSSGLGKWVAST